MKDNLRKINLLHSNDIHGIFVGKENGEGVIEHSLAQVAGFVSKKKEENPDTIYCIAGDVFQGSLIDSDFLGLSTMDILNLIDIDVMSLGNHELDYGIAHMIFVSRYADFPVINANFQVRKNGRCLFKPYNIVELNGLNVLFIGLITSSIIDQTVAEGLIGTFVTVEDCAKEVANIKEQIKEKGKKADITVLLTHIGYEADIELAKSLSPDLGVDIIVGGHSHTYLEEPTVENGIVILQAGMENTHIGDFEIYYDEEKGKIDHWKWEMVPVDEEHCPTDKFVRAMVNTYVMDIDEKYGKVLTRFKRTLDNYGRHNPTEVGQLFADAFTDSLDIDIMFMASSSLRCYSLDMTLTLQDLREAYPYNGELYKVKVKGSTLKKIVRHILRDDVLDNGEETFFHTSKALHIVYDRTKNKIDITFNGKPVRANQVFTLGFQEFYYLNAETGLGVSFEELEKLGERKILAPDAYEVLKEYFQGRTGLGKKIDDRLIVIPELVVKRKKG